MIDNFQASLSAVLKDEGGNDDDPADHGGRTSRGITQREYDAWRALKGQVPRDVWTATFNEISTIYHDEYWAPYCDQFPLGVDYLYFDMAVNAGPRRAAILLQRALGVADDGRIGPITRLAVTKADPVQLLALYTAAKRMFYISLHQPRFIKGWLNRCNHVQQIASAMIAGANAATV
jgi:lysozyme family protein